MLDEIDLVDEGWLEPIDSVPKADFRKMRAKVLAGEWDLWRLEGNAQGVAVTYPDSGRLFIYYLHGKDLFGTLTKEDLLEASRSEGCKGIWAETNSRATWKILKRLGFVAYAEGPDWWCVELKDGKL